MKEKFWLTFIFLCVTFFTNGQEVLQYPDSLYRAEKFMDAIIEYERVILTSTSISTTNEARYKKALVYRDMEKYEKALESMSRISYFGLEDSIHFRYRYQMAFCYYLNQNFSQCESQFIQLDTYIKDTSLIRKIFLLRALNYNELREWVNANEYAVKYIKNNFSNNNQLLIEINEMYSEKNLPKMKNKRLAGLLKYVPGFGQIYAGSIGEGVLNLSLNTAAIYLGVNQVLKSFYVTGYFVATIPVSKFYFGSRKRTDFLIEKKNYERIRAFNDEVKTILLN